MKSMIRLNVPLEWPFSLFFTEESVTIDIDEIKEWKEPKTFTNFSYDLAFFQQVEAYRPWNFTEEHIPFLLTKWKEIERECQKLFSERKTKLTMEPMKEGIALFFSMLFWIHGKPVQFQNWNYDIDELSIKPVNLVERLTFIIQRPTIYHAFVQLSELFRELEKHFVKSKIKNRLRQ